MPVGVCIKRLHPAYKDDLAVLGGCKFCHQELLASLAYSNFVDAILTFQNGRYPLPSERAKFNFRVDIDIRGMNAAKATTHD
jgi:hypothetical protein